MIMVLGPGFVLIILQLGRNVSCHSNVFFARACGTNPYLAHCLARMLSSGACHVRRTV